MSADTHTEGCRQWQDAAPGQRKCVCAVGWPERDTSCIEHPALYVGQLPDGTDVKLDVYADGTHEVAVRDMDSRRWGVPVVLTLEPVARPALTAAELVAQVKAEAEAERLARLEAGLRRWGQ